MIKRYFYSISAIISLLIIASCTQQTPFVESDVVYQLNVTVDPAEAGSVTPATREVTEGRKVEISASPNEGWVFESWQGDHTGSENPVSITMNSDKDILAKFVKKEYALTVTIEGEGTVTERVVNNKAADFPHGTTVELTANPAAGWVFSHWDGDVNAESNPVQIVIDSEKEVKAVFVVREFNLSIQTEGQGSVSERMISDSSSPFQTVELTANPSQGWRFVEWRGDVSGSDNPVRTTMDREKQVTAIFAQESYTLTINTEGEGSVSRTLQSGNESGGDYLSGSVVELTATAASGWQFSHWTGDLSESENPDQITMNSNKSVTAIFVSDTYTLTVNTEGEGSVGRVLQSGNESGGSYTSGSVVELTATAASDWEFSHWTGDVTGSANPAQITMNSDKSVTAVFVSESYTLTVNTEGEGSVSKTLQSGSESDGQFESGSVVELTANAEDGWEFVRWQGDLSGGQNPQSITINANKTVTAVFEELEEEEFSGGDGSEMNPFQVSNIDELQRVADYPDAHFVQISNINANVTTSWNGGDGFNPIGSFNSPFRGSYDGDGFEISGLRINRPNEEYVGLFGNVDGATIKNMRLVNVTIAGDRNVGGLVGVIYRNGTIENSLTTGNVSGNSNVGGLAGSISGTELSNSQARVDVSGDVNVGGLVGINGSLGSRIIDSYAEGDVSGSDKVGGLVGVNERQTTIENSFATGTVTGTGDQIGGLVGFSDFAVNITDSHATGNVSGDERVGGLVGDNGGSGISRSYATGNVSGDEMIGGLVGKIVGPGVINSSHARGNVSGGDMLGGLVGSKYATHINDSYALGNITGKDEVGGLVGESLAGQISNSYALGRVIGEDAVGGLVGINDTDGQNVHDAGQIFNSYAHGSVTGEDEVGGLVGINTNQAVITSSYAKGRVSGDDNVGGLVGLNDADIVSSYWDVEATGQSSGAGDGSTNGATGLTTPEMTGSSAETNMPEFDWSSIWMTTSNYPILRWQDGVLASN